jgi:cell division protein FtsB
MLLRKPSRDQLALGVALVAALATVGGLVWGFGQQLALARKMQVEEMRLERVVTAERMRHDGLVAQLKYIESDEYVEHWARVKARMAKSGEVAVVPLGDPSAEPVGDAQPAPVPSTQDRPFWVAWWELLFPATD